MTVDIKGNLEPDMTAEVPLEMTMSRVLLLPTDMDEDKVSDLYLDEKTREDMAIKKAMEGMGLMKCLVKEVGPGIYAVENGAFIPVQSKVGDVAYVYPNAFEAVIKVNNIRYFIYQDRNIIAKDKKPAI